MIPSGENLTPKNNLERDNKKIDNPSKLVADFFKRIRESFHPHKDKVSTNYETLGDFTGFIPEYLNRIKNFQKEENPIHTNYDLAFYLNSSDSLTSLDQLDQTGKKIMTVSGSGEFNHAFIKNGAEEIYSFDVSPAAAFNSELRHLALCHLDMDDYLNLFGDWTNAWDTADNEHFIYNQEIYHKIKNKLSAEAQLYFELLFKEPELIKFDRRSVFRGFARARTNGKYRFNRFIGDIITTEKEYKELQKKAQQVKFTQVICNINELADMIDSNKPDQIYQTNVGYTLERTIRIALANAKQNSEILCSLAANTERFQQENNPFYYQDQGDFYYQDKKLKPGDEIIYEMRNSNSDIIEIPIKIIGLDRNALFGITAMINSGEVK